MDKNNRIVFLSGGLGGDGRTSRTCRGSLSDGGLYGVRGGGGERAGKSMPNPVSLIGMIKNRRIFSFYDTF